MKAVFNIEKKELSYDQRTSSVLFLNDKDFTDFIGKEGEGYAISALNDCPFSMLLPNCPSQDQLPLLTKSDVTYIVWWDAPYKTTQFAMTELITLNFSLTPKMKHELYLTTDALEGKEIINLLEQMLKEYAVSNEPVRLIASEEHISIFLDTSDFIEWKPLSLTPQGYALRLEPGLQVQTVHTKINYKEPL